MKHEISTYRTKQSLAASLRCLLEQKPLSKITVSEIVAGCGVNRKTFYYHFQDIYSLLHWMLEQDTMEVIRDYQKHDNYHEILLFALQYLDGNQHLLNCVCDLAGYMEVRRFLMQSLTELTYPLILKAEAESDITLNEVFRKRLCHFYSTALSGFFSGDSAGFRHPGLRVIHSGCAHYFSGIPALYHSVQRKAIPA